MRSTSRTNGPRSSDAARAGLASVEIVRARERALDRAVFPHVNFQAALAGRGSGAEMPGQPILGNGLWLQVPNWAAGLSVTFPAFDIFSVNARNGLFKMVGAPSTPSDVVETRLGRFRELDAVVRPLAPRAEVDALTFAA